MKLILASKEKYFLERGYSLLGLPKEELKIGIINTALKSVKDTEYLKYMEEYREMMNSSGIDFREFDIDGKTEQEIRSFFADRNVIQINGGNPFFLLKKIRETKFDIILKELINKGYMYIGCSSGTYIMTPTIEIGGWKLSRNKYGLTDFTALSYVPFLIKCHYTDDKKEEVLARMKNLKYPLKLLKDDQVILVENGNYKFVGDGEEVILK